MKKPLLLLVSILLVILIVFFGFRQYNRSLSPAVIAEYNTDELNVKVEYGQPAKKGRFIFGREQDNPLLPYGKVWRTGANEATTVEFKEDVLFAERPVKAGKYSLWTVPGPGSWKVILNSQTGQWGTEYNDGKDLFKSEVPIRVRPRVQQVFTIYFEKHHNGTNMILSWDQIEAIIPIQPR
jgi:hypothetical protein